MDASSPIFIYPRSLFVSPNHSRGSKFRDVTIAQRHCANLPTFFINVSLITNLFAFVLVLSNY